MTFKVDHKIREYVDNYEIFLEKNKIFHSRSINVNNYLYPIYFYKKGDIYISSTSVFELIKFKKSYSRNFYFTTNHFYRPSYNTIDQKIKRFRSKTTSSYQLEDEDQIANIGANLMQDYITEIENLFPEYLHLLLMGGKDSQNILLCKRNKKWIVFSGEPNTENSLNFIQENNLETHEFIRGLPEANDKYYENEVLYSDCLYDLAHVRWVAQIKEIVDRYDGKIILWLGTNGDGLFSMNNNHRDKDYYVVQDLHVATSQGVLHQAYKNILNIPVLSPYHSPRMIKELICKFDPYYIKDSLDIRPRVGEILFGKKVKYPESNPTPPVYLRKRSKDINIYESELIKLNIHMERYIIISFFYNKLDFILTLLDRHSNKRRKHISKVLFPLRKFLSIFIPVLKINRHDMAKLERK